MGVRSSCGQKPVFGSEGKKKRVKGLFLYPAGKLRRGSPPVGVVDFQAVEPQRPQSSEKSFRRRRVKAGMGQDSDAPCTMKDLNGFSCRDFIQGASFPSPVHRLPYQLFLCQGLPLEQKGMGGMRKDRARPFLPGFPLMQEESLQPLVGGVETVPQNMDRLMLDPCGDLHPRYDPEATDIQVKPP